jgi:hypothetical protein
MRGKWAEGIPPKGFFWVLKDQLALSERPGGQARDHRPVRRREEILWLRDQGFTLVLSLLPSGHNLHAYDELELPWRHHPLRGLSDLRTVLPGLYRAIDEGITGGGRLLLHREELGDLVSGVAAGYLLYSGRLSEGASAIFAIERLGRRQLGFEGREVVALVSELGLGNAGAGAGSPRR